MGYPHTDFLCRKARNIKIIVSVHIFMLLCVIQVEEVKIGLR